VKFTCTRCGESRDAERFSVKRSGLPRDDIKNLRMPCKDCVNERNRTDERKRIASREAARRWRAANPEAARNKYLWDNHKVTPEQFESLLALQGGVCAICGGTAGRTRKLSVDHDHTCCPGSTSCGKCVRGLLCMSCNAGIGSLKDDPARVQAALDYLINYRRTNDP
jgi:hypothetical protein